MNHGFRKRGRQQTIASRRPAKKQHERAVIDEFLTWLNKHRGTRFKVVAEPDPPDAIIASVRAKSWIEVADVFWTTNYARHLYSYATPGERRYPLNPGYYSQMDQAFAQCFVYVLSAKLKKRSYLPFLKRYGAGYLVIRVQHPWFDGQTIREMRDYWRAEQPVRNLGCFDAVYVKFSSMNRLAFRKWQV